MTESFSEIIVCTCVPALDSDGSAAESPSNKERGSFLWHVQHSRNEKLERIFIYVGDKDSVSLVLKSIQAL